MGGNDWPSAVFKGQTKDKKRLIGKDPDSGKD